jgi:hypothetical protein
VAWPFFFVNRLRHETSGGHEIIFFGETSLQNGGYGFQRQIFYFCYFTYFTALEVHAFKIQIYYLKVHPERNWLYSDYDVS